MSDNTNDSNVPQMPKGFGHPKHDAMTDDEQSDAIDHIMSVMDDTADNGTTEK